MDSSTSDESVCEFVEGKIKDTSHTVAGSGRWLYVDNPGIALPEHGWKLHVSARPSTLYATLNRVLPILFDAACSFKVVADTSRLAALNSFDNPNPGSVGKAITVYPDQEDPERIVELATMLANAVSGMVAPVITSDKRVRSDAPVYYRYGPFSPRYRTDARGQVVLVMLGPSGEEFPGQAGSEYRCPPWADDPFSTGPSSSKHSSAARALLGNRYQLRSGVHRRTRGAVYRAHDTESGEPVIVKHAYPWVGENAAGVDTRVHLRNERQILSILEETSAVPRLVDHFRHAEEEFLVLSDLGGRTLADDIAEHGLYVNTRDCDANLVPRHDGETLDALASRLMVLLDEVHEHGVILRDLTPKNILLTGDRQLRLIDFEISFHSGIQLHGFTAAYASPEQCAGRSARLEDDYFSLGATLFHAATGMTPVAAADGGQPCSARTIDCLIGVYPRLAERSAQGSLACIPDLLSGDSERQRQAVAVMRSGFRSAGATRDVRTAQVAPEWDARAEARRLLGKLHDYAGQVGDPAEGIPLPHCLHTGNAGIGLELLQHADGASQSLAARLFHHAIHTADRVGAPTPGLMFGSTGTAVALATYVSTFEDERERPEPARVLDAIVRMAPPEPSYLPEPGQIGDDYTHGLAGVGIGHLLLARLTGELHHLDVADVCAERLASGDVAAERASEDQDDPHTGASVRHGFAHGTAGVMAFLLEYRNACGPRPDVEKALDRCCQVLASQVHASLFATLTPRVRPMVVSWCQGLSGMGACLLRAAQVLDHPDYLELARQAAEGAMRVAARVVATDQCCGLAGLGDFVLDLASVDTCDRDDGRSDAEQIAEILLTRFPSPGREPELAHDHRGFQDPGTHQRHCWGTGDAGRLAFLRRLHTGGSRLWTFPSVR